MAHYSIGIIGCGPWGLAVLERIIAHYSMAEQQDLQVELHIIESNRLGAGVYDERLPEYLLLNTECSQINLFGSTFLHTAEPFYSKFLNFYDWLVLHDVQIDEGGNKRGVKPTDYVARKWLGQYLNWVFRTLVSHLPPNVTHDVHEQKAVDIMNRGAKELIELEDGTSVLVDTIFITIGHAESIDFKHDASTSYKWGDILSPFPHQRILDLVRPGDKVLLAGMGLAAIDVISCLTIGKGGEFIRTSAGVLNYKPSGQEPVIHQFSRSGLPFHSRPNKLTDNSSSYAPSFLTKQQVDRLREQHAKLDFRTHILTLLYMEMKEVFYRIKAGQIGQKAISEAVELQQNYRVFDPESEVFGPKKHFRDSMAYQSFFIEQLQADITESIKNTPSPVKEAIELIRILRDMIRYAVDFDGLTASSYIDFYTTIMPMFYRTVVGPPVYKTEQLLALIKSGIVHQSLGRNPAIRFVNEKGKWEANSTEYETPIRIGADHFVKGYFESNLLDSPASQLLQRLMARGRITPCANAGRGIHCNRDFHPVNGCGKIEENMYVLGLLTDGTRHFNLYIPSPNSRARAFVDADNCVLDIIKKCRNHEDLLRA
ncbi:FAD/NAD(P)-binding protein [Paenibacillus alvei]|uniref:FAD/NAD(P)-binding protein n=1 Tax=Paenibacillus alvei TaxID=44250 RepID=UPI0003861D8F|nr:FAD/NAD(P)-binding protein [Paenibacillus alvei]EPY13410.1 hypothetical protein PAAL66ix_07856 [Paenibacillus alvei A6-6i-x]